MATIDGTYKSAVQPSDDKTIPTAARTGQAQITKIHETFFIEDIDQINMFKIPIKGELTVVISEKNIKNKVLNENKIIKKAKLYLKKYSLKDVVDLIFEQEKTNRKKIYQICLNLKKNEKIN